MKYCRSVVGFVALLAAGATTGYPLDGYDDTGIRRVEGARLAHEGVIRDLRQPPGALLTTEQVDLRLLDAQEFELPMPDPLFTARIVELLGEDADAYGIAVLDLSNPDEPRYAEHRGDYRQNVGSVGKLLAALGFFQALADAWPQSTEWRGHVLRDTQVTADGFAHSDHHTIRLFDPETRTLVRRPVRDGDVGSPWEWLDWMLSVSSNSAAAIVMREAMILRSVGAGYPLSEQAAAAFWDDLPARGRTELFQRTFWEPVARNGLDLTQFRQGSFFTAEGKRRVNGGGDSYGTARELMRFALRLEQGRIVDQWTSRQFKRLLYMTERRIRYASSPALEGAAVYFKSGSLYSCVPEAGYSCGAYRGNARNYMNSVAIIEAPAGERRLHYIVTLVSNVLRKNSAAAQQALATDIQRLIEAHHEPSSPLSDPVVQEGGPASP
ncbi:MAG TPA: hypothetical protein VLT59_07320 [Steroidobacteraceae bacterium]|nr:hypothetical protein [Steroidobacteraceae bacterium]